jgi:hypothetical protein
MNPASAIHRGNYSLPHGQIQAIKGAKCGGVGARLVGGLHSVRSYTHSTQRQHGQLQLAQLRNKEQQDITARCCTELQLKPPL